MPPCGLRGGRRWQCGVRILLAENPFAACSSLASLLLPTSGSLLQLDALPVWGWSGGECEGAGAASPPVPCCACLCFIRPAVLSPVGAFPPSPLCFSLSCLLLASSSLGLCLSSFLLQPPCLCTCNSQCERPQCTRTHPYPGVTGEGQTLQD